MLDKLGASIYVQILHRHRSRRLAIVEVQHTAESTTTSNSCVIRSHKGGRMDQSILEALVVSFAHVSVETGEGQAQLPPRSFPHD